MSIFLQIHTDEQSTIDLFKEASPSVVFITTAARVDLFNRNPQDGVAYRDSVTILEFARWETIGVDGFGSLSRRPLPDALALDYLRKTRTKPKQAGVCWRVLQLHMCIIYFFSGLTKALGVSWWNGTALWRSLTSPPYDVISPQIWATLAPVIPVLGIGVWVLELGYPIFIWLRKTRFVWFLGIIFMHVAIAVTMGLYLFALVMIVLNLAAFGTEILPLSSTA